MEKKLLKTFEPVQLELAFFNKDVITTSGQFFGEYDSWENDLAEEELL